MSYPYLYLYHLYYSHYQGTDSPLWGTLYLLQFCFFAFVIMEGLLKLYQITTPSEQRYLFLKKIIKSLPFLIPLYFSLLVLGLISILNNGGNFLIYILTSILLYFFFRTYLFLAEFPAETAYEIISVFCHPSREKIKNQIFTFWTLIESLKKKRLIVFLFLIFITAVVLIANVFAFSNLINKLNRQPQLSNWHLIIGALIVGGGSLIAYTILEVFHYGKPNIPITEHKKSNLLKKVIENTSITVGVPPPDFKILAYNNPTIFSTYPNFGKPTIYITAPLLNMANKTELEALVAHEFAAIFSGRILYFKRIHNILIILRNLTFLCFLLFLIEINFWGSIYWFILLLSTTANLIEVAKPDKSPFDMAGRLLNPPLLLITFLSYLIFYSAGYIEEIYTDIKTIEFTRYPKGIYSILEKLKKYKGPRDRLPKRFRYLYFTAEGTMIDKILMPHPVIRKREAELKKTDPLLKTSSSLSQQIICPNCKKPMKETRLLGLYGSAKSFYCRYCDAFWFNTFDLWLISTKPFGMKTKNKKRG